MGEKRAVRSAGKSRNVNPITAEIPTPPGTRMNHLRRLAVQALLSILVLACQEPHDPASASTELTPVDLLREARDLAVRAPAVWPGFHLKDQVLAITVPESGPVYAAGPGAGDAAGFEPLEGEEGIFMRRGHPPDDLSGLRVAAPWGASGTATLITYGDRRTLGHLIHESFHTFQALLPDDRFAGGGGNVPFPDSSLAALTLLNLEGRLITDALSETDDAGARLLTRKALAVRERRCRDIPQDQCERQRVLEQREGAAEYVEWRLLELGGHLNNPVDSLRGTIAHLGDGRQLDRFHFYGSGQGWMRLLDRFADSDWKGRVEGRAPDLVLMEELEAPTSELAEAALSGALAEEATREAHRFLAAVQMSRDSIVDAFWRQPGVPVRVRLDRGPTRATGDPDAALAIVSEGENEVSYVVNLREANHWYPGDLDMRTTVRSAVRIGGCSDVSFCLSVVSPVDGHTATVNGRPIPLDRPGTAAGRVHLDLPTLAFHSDRAVLRVFGDSIEIRVDES